MNNVQCKRNTTCAPRLTMTSLPVRNPESWARLEHYLSSLRPGDVTTVAETMGATALTSETVAMVLDALSRAELFDRRDQHYIRR
jgi:hypothetical protein